MKHPTRETLIQYIHWELPEREQRILDTHLAQCSSCAELYAQLVEAELPAPRVPQDFTERVMAQVRLTPLRKERSFAARYVAAAAIALVEERADIYLVSDWPDEAVRGLFMTPFPNAQAAFDAAVQRCGSSATVIAMPYGGSTLPRAET